MALPDCTVGFVGCGNMGGAILKGILNAQSGQSIEQSKISRFIACTKTAASSDRLKDSISPENQAKVHFTHAQTLQAMQDADVVILGFKPYMAEDILGQKGVLEALRGKLVISLLAGQTPKALAGYIQAGEEPEAESSPEPVIVRVIPNMGAQYLQSMTVIDTDNKALPPHMAEILEYIFEQVGAVKYVASDLFDLGSMIVGASMALLTVPIEGLLDGCVAEGMRRADAMEIVLQGLRGLTAILESGTHPAVLREQISSPRGCTIQALMTLEREGSRSDFADALVNGTRHLRKSDK